MNTIWKFPLEVTDEQIIEMPGDARLLHVEDASNALAAVISEEHRLNLWALVESDGPKAQRRIVIHGTGHPVERTTGAAQHIGTVVTLSGKLVWHVFDGGER